MAATKISAFKISSKSQRMALKLTALAVACRAMLAPQPKTLSLRSTSQSHQTYSSNANRSAALQALLISALALPGMAGTAFASSDDVVNTTTSKVQQLPSLDDTAHYDEAQEFGIQYSHYQESSRNLYGTVGTGTIAPTPGSPVAGFTNGIISMPSMPGVTADGQHVYGRFRIGDRTRIGFDYVEDIWSGASPLATLPSNMVTSASANSVAGGYFDANGKPLYLSRYQANANPNLPNATPQQVVLSPDPQMGHAMGYASAEARKQTSLKYGYDWNEASLDVGAGISSEVDFTSQFANVAGKFDFNDKLTTVNTGLSFTAGNTHAEWNTDQYARMALDAYPEQFNPATLTFSNANVAGQYSGTFKGPILAPVITGSRQDIALTAGITQVVNKNDVFSTGIGFTNTTGFLSNPWKGAYVLYQGQVAASPNVLSSYPNVMFWSGGLEMEHRPSLRNQLTWDTSYLHYFEPVNAAGQVHYSLFADSWGIVAHTVDAEWRQSLGTKWVVTPKLRYYTQSAAYFYGPYFFANSISDLPNLYYSSDERLSSYGTVSTGITVSKQLDRGLKLEMGAEYYKRAGSLVLGGGGEAGYADIQATTVNVVLRGNLDWLGGSNLKGDSGEHNHAAHNAEQEDILAGVRPKMADMPSMPHHNLEQGNTAEPASQTATLSPTVTSSEAMAAMPDMQGMADMPGMSHDSMASADMTKDDSAEHSMHMAHHHQGDAPAGVMGAHMMDEPGSVMLGYTFEQDKQGNTLQTGTQAIPLNTSGTKMYSTGMVMNMNMFELMYAQNKWLNWMVMPQFIDMTMGMFMYEGISGSMVMHDMRSHSFMASGGLGDTDVAALIRLWDNGSQHLHLTQDLSIPTGSVNVRADSTGTVYPYGMQLGSGTWDYKPNLTYTGNAQSWSWGAQLGGTIRLQKQNSSGYVLGNEADITAWGGYQLTSWLSGTLRGIYSDKGTINGAFNNPQGTSANVPTASLPLYSLDTGSYGGYFGDVGLGLTAAMGSGAYANDKVSVEYLKPVYTNFHGTQNNRIGTLFLSAKFMF